MKYTMTVTTNAAEEDVFRLSSEKNVEIDVGITDAEGATALKAMFSEILTTLTRDGSASISYVETAEYKNEMYKEVCKEYIEVLAIEIENAKARLEAEGIISTVQL